VTSLWRVSVRVPPDRSEATRATFVALAPKGFEESDVDGELELALYAAADELGSLRARLPEATVARVEEGWEDAWRVFHRPVEVAGIWLGPPWETPPDPSCAVVIDPGRAFGTGGHPTTRLCVELLARIASRQSLLDVGCGSGVLVIAAAKLGFAPAIGVDSDAHAIAAAEANAAANGFELDFRHADARVDPLPAAELSVANISEELVAAVAPRLDCRLLVTSGYFEPHAPQLPGFRTIGRRKLDGWAADLHARE